MNFTPSLTIITPESNQTINARPNATSSQASSDEEGANPSTSIVAIVAVPMMLLMMVACAFVIWARRRKKSNQKISETQSDPGELESEVPPQFRPKGELSAEDARHEIDGCKRRHEVRDGSRPELDTESSDDIFADWGNADVVWREEMQAEEVAKEKEGDDIAER